jgi:hypothetical protein
LEAAGKLNLDTALKQWPAETCGKGAPDDWTILVVEG